MLRRRAVRNSPDAKGTYRKCSDSKTLQANHNLLLADWELLVRNIADTMVKEQSQTSLLNVRKDFYSLLSHCIPDTVIITVWLLDRKLLTAVLDVG